MKLLFVVHRYPPYRGGSEYYVQQMAEESLSRGHEVYVFTNDHMGDLNGVRVTSDASILDEQFDLIIVHGGGCNNQNQVHVKSEYIKSPILYLIILPSTNAICMKGMANAKYLGCSTQADYDHCMKYSYESKIRRVRHGIVAPQVPIVQPFREKYQIKTKYMLLTCGGFWAHKNMMELAWIVDELKLNNTTLVCTGYHNNNTHKPKNSEYVRSFFIEDRNEVIQAIHEADLYIMNSYEEGYGLVLLEAMSLRTPWIARGIAGALQLKDYGIVYNDRNELAELLMNVEKTISQIDTQVAYDYVMNNHLIKNTVDDLLTCVN